MYHTPSVSGLEYVRDLDNSNVFLSGACTKGVSQVSLDFGVPVAFGVLTVDSIEQAIERAGTKAGNKGGEAALSAIEMVNLLREFES